MNQVVLIGRITKEPEIKYTQSGVAVVSFTLAVNRDFKNPNGEYDADFISCVAWRQQAEFIANYIKKGYLIGVSGSIQTRSYQGQDGKNVYVTEVVLDKVENLTPKENNQEIPADKWRKENGLEVKEEDLPF